MITEDERIFNEDAILFLDMYEKAQDKPILIKELCRKTLRSQRSSVKELCLLMAEALELVDEQHPLPMLISHMIRNKCCPRPHEWGYGRCERMVGIQADL
jgi:hypothetical protein